MKRRELGIYIGGERRTGNEGPPQKNNGGGRPRVTLNEKGQRKEKEEKNREEMDTP